MRTHLVIVVLVAAVLPALGVLGKTIPEGNVTLTANGTPVVTIPDGKIIGTNHVTVDKKLTYSAFRGIPYAQPPLGDLRFSSPVKNSGWNGYLDATNDAEVCIQGNGDAIRGSEDCLYLNVYTPKNAKKLAVMVWIYGGAFTGGDSTYRFFGPDYLLEDDVVYVSFNYRLGVFGWLSTEDQTVSGNWALKDMVLALKWVKENIEYFGGDPDRVTIFGESAGGVAVSYLLQIPQAKGLFDAAIIQSGNSENLFALSTKARQSAFQVGLNLGIPTLLSRTLVQRLRGIESYRLQRTAMSVLTQVYALNPLRGLPWAPVIEAAGPDAVFTEQSDEYLRSGRFPSKVPVFMGYNSNEAGHAHGLPERLRQYLMLFDVSPSNLAPFSLGSTDRVRAQAANEIRTKFFGTASLNSQFDEVVRFINADQFTRGTRRMAENMAPYTSVYFYVFGYKGLIAGENPYNGVGHAEQLTYLFRSYNPVYSQEDLRVRAKLVRLFTNFAKYFNPTPRKEALLDNIIWPTVKGNNANLDFLVLNYTLSTSVNPDDEDYRFYQNIFNKYGVQPYSTY